MRHLIFALLLAAVLSSCGDIVIGPVDHSCPTKPYRGPDGSGCSVGRPAPWHITASWVRPLCSTGTSPRHCAHGLDVPSRCPGRTSQVIRTWPESASTRRASSVHDKGPAAPRLSTSTTRTVPLSHRKRHRVRQVALAALEGLPRLHREGAPAVGIEQRRARCSSRSTAWTTKATYDGPTSKLITVTPGYLKRSLN